MLTSPNDDVHGLILENMEMAERIGQKYASRHGKHLDECVAEAYFWLSHFFIVDIRLYHNAVEYKRTLGIYIKRALIKYFERIGRSHGEKLQEKVIKNTDEEMIAYLSGMMPDEQAFQVFNYIRGGVNLYEVDLVDPLLTKTLKRLRLAVSGRLLRLKEMKRLGYPTSREVIGDEGEMADNWEEKDREACRAA